MKILELKNTVTKIKTSRDNLAIVMTQLKRHWNGRHINRKYHRSKNVIKEGKLRKQYRSEKSSTCAAKVQGTKRKGAEAAFDETMASKSPNG